jgi:8-oxo-dGTP diphosphatase
LYTLRLMSVAVLFNGDDMLMMKRSPNRTLSPGKWAGIGGHLEPAELGDPRTACLREVEEETGLQPEDIEDLELRYILLRLNGNDLRQQFVYVGRTRHRHVRDTDEGVLHWVPRTEILNRDIPFVFKTLLQHWLETERSEQLWMGTATLDLSGGTDTPSIVWVPVVDPKLS